MSEPSKERKKNEEIQVDITRNFEELAGKSIITSKL